MVPGPRLQLGERQRSGRGTLRRELPARDLQRENPHGTQGQDEETPRPEPGPGGRLCPDVRRARRLRTLRKRWKRELERTPQTAHQMPRVAKQKLDPRAHATAFPPLVPPANFAPMSELDALNEEDDRAARFAREAAVRHAVASTTANTTRRFPSPSPTTPAPEPSSVNPLVNPFVAVGTVVAEPPCALDAAMVHSKLVVVRSDGKKVAVFMTPQGERRLDAADMAHRLPEGAKIHKDDESQYTATQIGAATPRPPLVTTSAREAIAQFNRHFHDV